MNCFAAAALSLVQIKPPQPSELTIRHPRFNHRRFLSELLEILKRAYNPEDWRTEMIRSRVLAGFLLTLAASCLAQEHQHGKAEKLGEVHFATSCDEAAQGEFNRAVALLHSFQFSRAIAGFNAVLGEDPTCGITYWGIALSDWSNPFAAGMKDKGQLQAGRESMERGKTTSAKTERERAYLTAVGRLYSDFESTPQRARLVAFFFFLKAGAFVFGSGLAIVPFLYGGVVNGFHWLTERQFLDAVAVAMITPGPVVITSGFIGYLVAGPLGAFAATLAVFLSPYLLVVLGRRTIGGLLRIAKSKHSCKESRRQRWELLQVRQSF